MCWLRTSSRRILKELIAHYATTYQSQLSSKSGSPPVTDGPRTFFSSITTGLRIPGQIDSSGEPIGDAAENTWNCIQNWLAGQNNLSWCLVFDSVDTEPEIERLNDLIHRCAHGHAIITSRQRVRDPCAKIISVSGLDRNASIKLLLGDREGDAGEAGKAADALGHLPIALSQAAAYVVKRELNFTQYLKRLSDNCTRLLGTAYLKYTEGVFSCWKLSVEAFMRSNPHAIDLLRLYSFLSPDGVSEELLRRGVEGIEWAQNDLSRLEEAVDDFVTYSLMACNLATPSRDKGQSFWVHPLVQLWARDSYSNEGSVVLEENKVRVAHLHERGAQAAICLVGVSIEPEDHLRTAQDWAHERNNVAHLNLCIHRYLMEQKVAGNCLDLTPAGNIVKGH
ncbi:hypothetical protein TWF106_003669 [Orbilia oligospora]|uniref:DUF7779 domain-containing protein n=1 Tax=Orbilia oligospora TaxID=2813651 RepID=A0A7C8Q3R5_ORBOL|nr:hypothetical protein TWF788_004273 [Orbilia oligospora]KAF3199838.1 hypothetical protein TWF106_003669 [Orbilia oligospora]